MFTVTLGRSLSVCSALASLAVASNMAGAQVIVTTDASAIAGGQIGTVVRPIATISDDSVRSYLTRFEPNVLDDDSGDATFVTMVLDNDGTYVRSSSRHAKVLEAVPGRVMMISGDSLRTIDAAPGRIVSLNGAGVRTVEGTAVQVISLNSDSLRTIAGFASDEIGAISTKRYAPGAMGKGQVIVSFVYLK